MIKEIKGIMKEMEIKLDEPVSVLMMSEIWGLSVKTISVWSLVQLLKQIVSSEHLVRLLDHKHR